MDVPLWLDDILVARWAKVPLGEFLDMDALSVARIKEVYYHVHKQGIKL